jgi:2-dehydro-3-deoxygalactonokinase
MERLLAIDWGSSALRGALLDEAGRVLDQRAAQRGMLTLEPAAFAAVFESTFGDWMDEPGTRCLMAGMVGSKQGWAEAPYCPCPAGLDEVASRLLPVRHAAHGRAREIAIVPGMACEHAGVPDVMRGEEVKVFGALELLDRRDGVLVLPGTHSKWAEVEAGRIRNFTTVMSGEFYALLRTHSILAKSLPEADTAFDLTAFDRGVERALESRSSLMQTAFGVRTLALFERLPAPARASYLSGLVIGEELRCRPLEGVGEVVLVAAPVLVERFERALRRLGVGARVLGEGAAWRGLWGIHRRALEIGAR